MYFELHEYNLDSTELKGRNKNFRLESGVREKSQYRRDDPISSLKVGSMGWTEKMANLRYTHC